MLDSAAPFQSVQKEITPDIHKWLKWLDQNQIAFNDLSVILDNQSHLYAKSVGNQQKLIIHNKKVNATLLNNYLDTLKPELLETPNNKTTKNLREEQEEKTSKAHSDLKLMDAVRIQKLILPKQEDLKKGFKNFFVVHEQQDVVGGDFYWYSRKGDNILLAIIDCTGHSVEGAMTSMVCNSLLNQSISDFDANNIDQVLVNFYNQLNQYNETSSDSYGIGAEIGLFCFNNKTEMITFCTTGISAFIKRDDGIEHLKSKKVIAYDKIENSIAKTSFPMKGVTGIYGFTDGLSDQFDAADKKKLGSKGILKMIEDEQDFDAHYYLSEINKWKGDNMQYDDITLIGIAI